MAMIFISALAVAFSGAMMPGPLLTYTIRQSLNAGPYSGFVIIAGHAVLELILIVLIFMGFDIILQSNAAQSVIGIVGGLLLAYMGADMVINALKNKIEIELNNNKSKTGNMLISGFAISAANPYFLLWWAIIGLGFLIQAYKLFGTAGVIVFFSGHILADFIWYGFVSVAVGTTRKFIKINLYRVIIAFLGGVLIFFGGTFFYNALSIFA
jgi:threonine/homoserine/homoserine lactone efflux protein